MSNSSAEQHASGGGEVLGEQNAGVPNLYWQAVPWDALRACERFVSLPAPDQVRGGAYC